MTYLGPVSKGEAKKSEKRFLIFFGASLLLGLGMVCSFYVSSLEAFWQNNKLWASGSFLIALSVIHLRFFNIKRNANPDNKAIKAFNPESPFNKTLEKIEYAVNLAWITGFILVAMSRWIGV